MNEIFHPLHTDIERPERFTYPFNYTPHPLCLLAAGELQRYIGSNGQWRDEVEKGKMFGVLVVTDATGDLGFLAAYSGLLAAGTTCHISCRRYMTVSSPTDISRPTSARFHPSTMR